MILAGAVFLFGLAMGSFLNNVVLRMEKGESAFKGRSHCPQCGHELGWIDLVPLLSFVLLLGKCRYCKKPISFQYPFMELATGLLFSALFLFVFPWFSQGVDNLAKPSFTQAMELFYLWTVASLLIVVFVYDLRNSIIPDIIIYPLIILAALFLLFIKQDLLLGSLLAALGAGFFFAAIYFLSQGKWMGFGDVKLAFFMGLFLSWPNILVALFLAFLLGAAAGLFLVALKKKGMKSEVPFGPFLITGMFLALWLGRTLLDWYFGILLV